jgi:hypothetical protein
MHKTHIIGYRANGSPVYSIAGGAEEGPDLAKLLATVEALDEDKRSAEEAPPSDEELAEARAALSEAAKDAAGGDRPDLESLRSIRSAIDKIDAETVTRTEQREAEKKEAEELLKGITVSDQPDPGDEGDKDDDADGNEGEGDEGADDKPEAKVRVASLSDAIKKSSKRRVERVKEPINSDVLVASTGIAQGYGLGQDADLDDVSRLFDRYAGQVKRGSSVLVHMEKMYPEERSLGLSAVENTRMIDAVIAPALNALTAAGGICEPLPADFTHPICGDRGRPIRDALVAFRADRGGARFAPSASWADLEDAITVWTAETDAAPSADTKACPRVECEDEVSATVDAIVACITVGNFQARFNPEFWRSRLDLLMVAHDRVAEQTLYATMIADPVTTTTLVPAGAGDGTIVDLLRVVQMQVAGIKDRNRLIGTRFVSILPANLRMALRTHLANQAPAGSLDQFAVADAQIANFFQVLNVTPVWSPDIELIGAQAGGAALAAYNTPFNVLTFPEGTFLFLDGGTLDLGTSISDSTLNATNDRQAFMETFEQVIGRGCEALLTPVAVAPDCICA